MTLDSPIQWPNVLPRMQSCLNNSTKYSTTTKAPNEVLYGFKTREALDFLREHNQEAEATEEIAEAFPNEGVSRTSSPDPLANEEHVPHTQRAQRTQSHRRSPSPRIAGEQATRRPDEQEMRPGEQSAELSDQDTAPDDYIPAKIDAADAIAYTAIKMKAYYDQRHQQQAYNIGDFVNLRLHRGYKLPGILNGKIGQQFAGPFRVIEKIGKLAYRLELPPTIKIHNIISVAHLEPATNPTDDPYSRARQESPPILVDGQEKWEIERILRKRVTRRGRGHRTEYLVRWVGYGPQDDTWISERNLGNAREILRDFNERENRDQDAALISDIST